MIKQDIFSLDLNQPSDQKIYVTVLNALQEELCNLIESKNEKVTTNESQPWDQIKNTISNFKNNNSLTFTLSKEDAESRKNSIVRFNSLSMLHPKAKAVSFIVNANVCSIDGLSYKFRERFYLTFSNKINKWHFLMSNNFDNTSNCIHFDSIEITSNGFLPHQGRVDYRDEYGFSCSPKNPNLIELKTIETTNIDSILLYIDNSGCPSITIPSPGYYFLSLITIYDWKMIA